MTKDPPLAEKVIMQDLTPKYSACATRAEKAKNNYIQKAVNALISS